MRQLRIVFVLGLIFLYGCGGKKVSVASLTAPKTSSVKSSAAVIPPERPVYTLFNPKFIGKGKKSLLFFAQAKDPFSAQSDTLLRKLYSSGSAKISTFRLDFATSTGSRFDYQVITPDTFVLVGTSGEREKSVIHPGEEELKKLLE
ncbi:hypothetical protein A3A67_03745 [Candidatus Peribacteria bacterium RIFCSPLOWO2_01_FULL_51_18]|nr:MAG: hypothetical protein A3C52_04565 [Candidatus Peribacteria bacterium RIFCSPHIGHO2_02_FULL_51_15]OGJ65137.1 MAG: hypothetical protein A3A67_03745 [Candidatus Peribacteria bacterium RIFCSPLOWO2_01_FULL_51_18]